MPNTEKVTLGRCLTRSYLRSLFFAMILIFKRCHKSSGIDVLSSSQVAIFLFIKLAFSFFSCLLNQQKLFVATNDVCENNLEGKFDSTMHNIESYNTLLYKYCNE